MRCTNVNQGVQGLSAGVCKLVLQAPARVSSMPGKSCQLQLTEHSGDAASVVPAAGMRVNSFLN